ncbi:hypothetical protein ACHAWF_008033 [Thalassiosira exigua]
MGMSRSNRRHRIQNDLFVIALLRKLRLPLFDPSNCPRCWCGQTHGCYGDHIFRCVSNNKTMMHNYIRDGIARDLQILLAGAGLILSSSSVETEREGVWECNPDLKPLDMAYDPDPTEKGIVRDVCPFASHGLDVTVTHAVSATPDLNPVNVLDTVAALAEKNLQEAEKGKLQRDGTTHVVSGLTVSGDELIGELVAKRILLTPLVIDPHGKWGPIMDYFLFDIVPDNPIRFGKNRPNAATMYKMATSHQAPRGIVQQAHQNWAASPRRRTFFGGSHTIPTPEIYAYAKFGLTITKALALHARKARRHFGYHPNPNHRSNRQTGGNAGEMSSGPPSDGSLASLRDLTDVELGGASL